MHRILIFLAGCAFGYVLGGYVDGYTGDDLANAPDETGLTSQAKEAAWQ